VPGAGPGAEHAEAADEEEAGRGGTALGRSEAGEPVRALRIPAGDGAAAGRGLAGEPQAGRKDMAAGGAEGPEAAAEAGPAVAERRIVREAEADAPGPCVVL